MIDIAFMNHLWQWVLTSLIGGIMCKMVFVDGGFVYCVTGFLSLHMRQKQCKVKISFEHSFGMCYLRGFYFISLRHL